MITGDLLKQIMPRLSDRKRAELLPPLQAAMNEFGVNTPKREAAFLAQLAHESAELNTFVENLNYGASGLMATWPKRFADMDTAKRYERNPEKIANHVYANRIGNGDEPSGDGWKFRGRGPIQITGRENYDKYGRGLNVDLIGDSERAGAPDVGFRVAGLYWKSNGLNELADAEDFVAITKRINGAMKGFEEREKYYLRAKGVLGVPASRGGLAPPPARGMTMPVFTRGNEELEEESPIPMPRKSVRKNAKRARAKVPKKKTPARGRTAKKKPTKKPTKAGKPKKKRVVKRRG